MNYKLLNEEELLKIVGGGFFYDFFYYIGSGYGEHMNNCDKIGYNSRFCQPLR